MIKQTILKHMDLFQPSETHPTPPKKKKKLMGDSYKA